MKSVNVNESYRFYLTKKFTKTVLKTHSCTQNRAINKFHMIKNKTLPYSQLNNGDECVQYNRCPANLPTSQWQQPYDLGWTPPLRFTTLNVMKGELMYQNNDGGLTYDLVICINFLKHSPTQSFKATNCFCLKFTY